MSTQRTIREIWEFQCANKRLHRLYPPSAANRSQSLASNKTLMKRLAVLLLTLMPALWASDFLPSTPNGQLVRQYLEAFNWGEAAMRAFLEKAPTATPIDERLARYRHMKADLVSLTPVRLSLKMAAAFS